MALPSSYFPADVLDPLVGWPTTMTTMDPFAPSWLPGVTGSTRRRTEEGREPNVVGAPGWTRSIPVDFIEREDVYVVRADIPGVHKSEIHVDVHDGNVLRFGHNPRAEREKEDVEETGTFHRAERVSTFRNRNLRMPDNADMEGPITAKYEDGVLEVIIKKKQVKPAAAQPANQIAVQ